MKVNMKTVQRFFTVSGVLVTVFVLMAALTPLSFAVNESTYNSLPINNNNPFTLPSDQSFPSISSYFYGTNSGIIDFYSGDTGSNQHWIRCIINNNLMRVNINKSGSSYYLSIKIIDNSSASDCKIYYTDMGTQYKAFTSLTWKVFALQPGYYQSFLLYSLSTNVYCANTPISSDLTSEELIRCLFNCNYPLYNDNSSSVRNDIINNQNSIASKQESQNNSRASREESLDNSRQSQIMNAGSNVTVSTIDNWVGGNNGLAGKLTELAATLSSNADIFSQNQSENQANLSRAGQFVGSVFNQIPTGITAAAVCFLIILIAVKVVGR